ncbi:MAG: multidrug resistance efflux transporter family protein [bacterium]|nr:multidrug resistance efflux transporter family protein [bacterium]
MKKALLYGIISSLFFAATFVLNSSMNLSGGYWMWSASLRYFFMLIILFTILWKSKRLHLVFEEIKRAKGSWLLYSTIGFGLFYAPLTFASNYGESWLVAGCWQLTILAGILLTPLFGKKFPRRSFGFSCIIIVGVFLIQYEQASVVSRKDILMSILPILVAAFAYPFGNRKMMEVTDGRLTTLERVFGMTLMSMPFWIVLSGFAVVNSGLPSGNQVFQSLIVAIFSGVIATILFFKATELVKHNPSQLAIIEATQSGEVLFSVLGEVLLLAGAAPGPIGWIGLGIIILGMIFSAL